MTTPALALDRRSYDQDGRLHAPRCRISKANVCGYYGQEIPGWQELGLQPDRIYQMYRDPAALAEAATSFENVPLTLDHIIVSADDFPAERIGGTLSNAVFEHPYLYADLTAWTREAIEGIESNEQRELSCAYYYTPRMIQGTSPDGVRYDGIMSGPIRANHVALVERGRAGPDVLVADEAPRMKRPKILQALSAILGNSAQPAQLAALDAALDEELQEVEVEHCVEDEFPDLDDEEKKAARDACGKDSLTDEEKREAYKAAKDAKAARDSEKDKDEEKAATDAAIKLAVDAAVSKATAGMVSREEAQRMATDAAESIKSLYSAREAVAAQVGVVALDTAEAVYRFALDKAGVPNKDVPAAALAALYAAVQHKPAGGAAQDAAPAAKVTDLFPSLANIRRG